MFKNAPQKFPLWILISNVHQACKHLMNTHWIFDGTWYQMMLEYIPAHSTVFNSWYVMDLAFNSTGEEEIICNRDF